MNNILTCPLCKEFYAPTIQLLLPHIRFVHSLQPGFSMPCNIDGCQRTFRNFKTFTNHLYQFHMISHTISATTSATGLSNDEMEVDGVESEDELIAGDLASANCEESVGDCTLDDHTDHDDTAQLEAMETESSIDKEIESFAAKWILKIREQYKLTQSTMENIIQDVSTLTQFLLAKVHTHVKESLQRVAVESSEVPGLDVIFNPESHFANPFQRLATFHLQTKYYKDHFGLVEPKSIVLGTTQRWKGSGKKRAYKTVQDTMMYVPISQTIATLLSDDFIMTEVSKVYQSPPGILSSYSDGQAYKTHPLFKQHCNGLQLILYFDEVEMCNPLGSKRKIHKLGFFYFQLANLPPWMRTKINDVLLVAVVRKSLIDKYGMQVVLKPIIEDIKNLEIGHEIILKRGNAAIGQMMIYGTLIAVSADNPASCSLGGFKEGGSAYRFCRQCMIKAEDIKRIAHEDQCILRTEDEHSKQCIELDSNPNMSKEYGINCNSILNELKYFHVCQGALIPDIMHDVLEGALAYEMKLMLMTFIQVDHYFELALLNEKIASFEYGYCEASNKPTQITHSTLIGDQNNLKQNASQSWFLGRYLPLMIGNMVPENDERWNCFILLLRIMAYLFAIKLTEDDLGILQDLIMDHHHCFVSLYPDRSIIPKQHYLIHTPRLFYKYGPLVNYWTMRFESKHKYFKGLANVIGNFINLPYTLAMRHQFFQCFLRLDDSHCSSYSFIEIGKGIAVKCDDYDYLTPLQGSEIYCSKWIKFRGITYKKGCVMTTGSSNQATMENFPVFSTIEELFILNGNQVYFYVKIYETKEFNHHYMCYFVSPTDTYKLLSLESFLSHLPLNIHKLNIPPVQFCIVPKFHLCI